MGVGSAVLPRCVLRSRAQDTTLSNCQNFNAMFFLFLWCCCWVPLCRALGYNETSNFLEIERRVLTEGIWSRQGMSCGGEAFVRPSSWAIQPPTKETIFSNTKTKQRQDTKQSIHQSSQRRHRLNVAIFLHSPLHPTPLPLSHTLTPASALPLPPSRGRPAPPPMPIRPLLPVSPPL